MIKAPESNEFNKGHSSFLFEELGGHTLVITLKVVTFLLCFGISKSFSLSLKIRRHHGSQSKRKGLAQNKEWEKRKEARCQPHLSRFTHFRSKSLFFFTLYTNENTLLSSSNSLILSVFFVHARSKEQFKQKVCYIMYAHSLQLPSYFPIPFPLHHT